MVWNSRFRNIDVFNTMNCQYLLMKLIIYEILLSVSMIIYCGFKKGSRTTSRFIANTPLHVCNNRNLTVELKERLDQVLCMQEMRWSFNFKILTNSVKITNLTLGNSEICANFVHFVHRSFTIYYPTESKHTGLMLHCFRVNETSSS